MTAVEDSTSTKTCPKCGESKPATLEFYYARKSRLQSHCKTCTAAAKAAKGIADNPEYHQAKQDLLHGLKHCVGCSCTKPLAEFYKKAKSVTTLCRPCQLEAQSKKRLDKSPALAQRRKLEMRGEKQCSCCLAIKAATAEHFYIDRGRCTSRCIACCLAYRKSYRETNPELVKEQLKEWAKKHKKYVADKRSEWAKKNAATRKAYNDAYYVRNKQTFINGNSRRSKARRKTDPVFAMTCRIRSAVGDAFRRMGYTKRSKTQAILGCSWMEFKTHIERQFVKGMHWGNRSAWHIDHIIPIATAITEDDVVRLNHFTNLRPMWALDNIRKGAEITSLL